MPKLSDYVKMAADEYIREHANSEPSARWIADFFCECGVQDEYPRQEPDSVRGDGAKRIKHARGASGEKNAPAARQDDPPAEVVAQGLIAGCSARRSPAIGRLGDQSCLKKVNARILENSYCSALPRIGGFLTRANKTPHPSVFRKIQTVLQIYCGGGGGGLPGGGGGGA